jgi:hypothetical protein
MRYKLTVRWGDSLDRPDLTKTYDIDASSPHDAIRLFKEELGYNPGVPMKAEPESFAESMARAAAALSRLNEAATEHLDYEREVVEQELLDEPGLQIEEVWGTQRYV